MYTTTALYRAHTRSAPARQSCGALVFTDVTPRHTSSVACAPCDAPALWSRAPICLPGDTVARRAAPAASITSRVTAAIPTM